MILSDGPNKVFSGTIVPDLCRMTVRNVNSISADVTENNFENYYNDACLSYFQIIWQLF